MRYELDPAPATRWFLKVLGLPSTLRIKCTQCGAAPSPGVGIHALREFDGEDWWFGYFLCCRHARAWTGQTCRCAAP